MRMRISRGAVDVLITWYNLVTWSVYFVFMAEPAERRGHVAAAVVDKVYVWGGYRGLAVSHDGPDKTSITFEVDILDVKVSTIWGCI